jgi:hypothetical protein
MVAQSALGDRGGVGASVVRSGHSAGRVPCSAGRCDAGSVPDNIMSWDPHREAWAYGPPPWQVQQWAHERYPVIQPSSLDFDMAVREKEARKRVKRALETLAALGNPGLQRREVPGRYRKSIVIRLFGSSRKVNLVTVEPAWPIGEFQWEHRHRGHKERETGYTPSGHVVPIHEAAETDDVDPDFCVLRIGREPNSAGKGRPLATVHLAAALEEMAVSFAHLR